MFNCSRNRKTRVNLHPRCVAPVEFTKGIAVDVIRDSKGEEITTDTAGFISNFAGKDEPGVVIHGSQEGYLYFQNCLSDISIEENPFPIFRVKTPAALYAWILIHCKVDLKTFKSGKPLHLICCYGNSKASMAQGLANYLNRDVIAYGTGVIYAHGARLLLGKGRHGVNNILIKKHGMRSLARPLTYSPILSRNT